MLVVLRSTSLKFCIHVDLEQHTNKRMQTDLAKRYALDSAADAERYMSLLKAGTDLLYRFDLDSAIAHDNEHVKR